MSEFAIRAEGLTKTYNNKVRALDGLGLSVACGTIFALLGPNGAGKSTTVKILTTLSLADSGSAFVAGFDVELQPDEVRRVIGYVSQKSGVDTESTGRENLRLQGQLYGLGGPALERRIDELLDRFRLKKAADLVSRTYSGGMQRKLDVAMGLIHRPRVLFLDEPTTGLDPEARSELWVQIGQLAAGGLTVLLTTHYLEEADQLASRVAIVDQGRVVADGSPDELKSELCGDSIHIEFSGEVPAGPLEGALAGLEGLGEVTVDGARMLARAERGATALPAILSALEARILSMLGVRVASVRIARPSLDEVYLRHTGRSFARAEAIN
jgi:ABC-2 type transport system ATP-binding protein